MEDVPACFLQMYRCAFMISYVSACWNTWAMRPVTTVMTPVPRKILVDLEGWRVFQQNQWEGASKQSDIVTRVWCMAGMVVRLSTQVATQLMVMQQGCECSVVACCTLLLILRWSQTQAGKHKHCCTQNQQVDSEITGVDVRRGFKNRQVLVGWLITVVQVG